MHKSPFFRFLGMVSWFLTALGSIHLGAMALGYDVFRQGFLATRPDLATGIAYIFGIAGIISLIMFFLFVTHKGHGCGCCSNCSC